ncbi:MAG: alpha/beta fold hydrolase [Geminicoccaceae bacterium]
MSLELAHIAYGESGAPVVILHGLLGSARNWSSFARQLGATHRMFALDLRNHGASPWADRMTYDQMAEDVRAFLARQGLPAAAVIGHSMGGKVAMRLALAHGQQVERLVVVDVAPVAYGRDFNAYVDAMRALDLSQIRRRSEADALLAEEIADTGVRGFLLQNLISSEDGLAWRVPLRALADNMPELTGFPETPDRERYEGPTLFVTGGRSDYVRPEHHAKILRLFPNARFSTIPDAGHWVHAEAPQQVLGVVGAFLG